MFRSRPVKRKGDLMKIKTKIPPIVQALALLAKTRADVARDYRKVPGESVELARWKQDQLVRARLAPR